MANYPSNMSMGVFNHDMPHEDNIIYRGIPVGKRHSPGDYQKDELGKIMATCLPHSRIEGGAVADPKNKLYGVEAGEMYTAEGVYSEHTDTIRAFLRAMDRRDNPEERERLEAEQKEKERKEEVAREIARGKQIAREEREAKAAKHKKISKAFKEMTTVSKQKKISETVEQEKQKAVEKLKPVTPKMGKKLEL